MPGIVVLLPRRERYAKIGGGAVSSVVDGLAWHSGMRRNIRVFGSPVDNPLSGAAFEPVNLAPLWHGGKTRRYLVSVVSKVRTTSEMPPSIIEIHNRPKYVAFLKKNLKQLALILYLHNDPRKMEGTETPQGRSEIAKRAQAVVCVSEYIKRCFIEGAEAAAQKVFVVRNAVDTDVLKPLPGGEKNKEIIFFGRTIFDKGPHLLVEAAENILPEFPDWKLVIIGSRYFGNSRAESYERELFRRVERMGRQGEITGYLPRGKVIERLQKASIAVLPSLWDEPIQLASMEAAACGCAVVTTRRGGIQEGMGEAALYLPEETPRAIENVLRRLMGDGKELKIWQKKARNHVVQNSDLRQSALALDKVRRNISFVSS